MPVSEGIKIIHDDDFSEAEYQQYIDEPYFRLSHSLQGLSAPLIPEGFLLCNIDFNDYANHITKCYDSIGVSESDLQSYATRSVYNPELWLAVKDKHNEELWQPALPNWIVRLAREYWSGYKYRRIIVDAG